MDAVLEFLMRTNKFAAMNVMSTPEHALPEEHIFKNITVLILTYNEEANIERSLEAVKWAAQILLVDSGSTDNTCEIARRLPQVRIVERKFDTFAGQCNFGLSQIDTTWVLSLDADYEISPQLAYQIDKLRDTDVGGYRASFIYRIHGRPLRASLYPPRIILYRRKGAHYVDEGHGHRVLVDGSVRLIKGVVYHDDRKPLSRWLQSQQSYAGREATHLLNEQNADLKWVDRVRKLGWPAPILVFIYVLIWKRCLFDGWPGWAYALQRLLAEIMIALEIVDRRLRGEPTQ